jgi:tryptophanyl-tRNA synthetase
MATHFNTKFGDTFKLPRHRIGVPEAVPGVDGEKMSKSYGNAIPIFARGKPLKKLLMSIKTDSTPLEDPKDPDTCTVFALFSLMASAEEKAELAAKYRGGGFGYGHAKLALLEKMNDYFGQMRERRDAFERRPDDVEEALQLGARKARVIARSVLDRARRNCGLD